MAVKCESYRRNRRKPSTITCDRTACTSPLGKSRGQRPGVPTKNSIEHKNDLPLGRLEASAKSNSG